MVTWFHEVKQLFLIPIPGVLTQTLGNIVGTWSAHWFMKVSVQFLRLCYSGMTYRGYYTVARRYEFYFRVAKQYFTNERCEWVKYCFCLEKIKLISSRRRVMFFLWYRQEDIDKIIDFYLPKSNCDCSNLQYLSNVRHLLQ